MRPKRSLRSLEELVVECWLLDVDPQFVKRWGKLALNVGLQGLSVSRNDTSVTYSSMNIAGGYRLLQREKLGLDILGGYRYVDFDYEFDDDSTGISTGTDFELTGPYVGLRASW